MGIVTGDLELDFKDAVGFYVQIVESMEGMYRRGDMRKEDFIDSLKKSSAVIPAHEFYQRMFERGEITKTEYKNLIIGRIEMLQCELDKIDKKKQ